MHFFNYILTVFLTLALSDISFAFYLLVKINLLNYSLKALEQCFQIFSTPNSNIMLIAPSTLPFQVTPN